MLFKNIVYGVMTENLKCFDFQTVYESNKNLQKNNLFCLRLKYTKLV